MKKSPSPIIGIEGATSMDGEAIAIHIEEPSGVVHSYSFPYEAAGEIIWKIQALANDAASKRHTDLPVVEIAARKAFSTSQVSLRRAPDGSAVLVLRLGSLHIAFEMNSQRLEELREALLHFQNQRTSNTSSGLH